MPEDALPFKVTFGRFVATTLVLAVGLFTFVRVLEDATVRWEGWWKKRKKNERIKVDQCPV
jgi:hypothetical protein